jgi:hypothetical protein
MDQAVAGTGKRKGAYEFLVEKIEGKKTLTRLRLRKKNNI